MREYRIQILYNRGDKMSTGKVPDLKKGNMLSMEDISNIVSSSAIIRAMSKIDVTVEPTDKEKLDQILDHPELLARAVGMILTGKTDAEIGKEFGITKVSVGFIRENQFVKALCEECFQDTIQDIKMGLAYNSKNAITSLAMLADPGNKVGEKVRYMAAMGILNTLLKVGGELDAAPKKVTNNLNVTNNVQNGAAKEAYERAVKDIASIMPVADNMYKPETEEE